MQNYSGGFMLKKILLPILVITVCASSVFGSGFSIYEQGAKATAMAGAFIAQADDPTANFYNPAGLAFLKGFHIGLGTTIIAPEFAFQGPENVDSKLYTSAEKDIFTPSTLYLSYNFMDRFTAGFGFYTLFGLSSTWGSEEDPWVGRYLATTSEVQTFYYNPNIAVRVLDNLSIAAGFSFIQANVNLEKSVYFPPRNVTGESALEAETTGSSFNVGVRYTLFKKLILGAVYRSNALLKFDDGDATFNFPTTGDPVIDAEVAAFFPSKTKGSADLELPNLIGVGIAYNFTENLKVEFDYMQLGWSSYDELVIKFEDPVAGQTESVAERNYEDSYSLRAGMQYNVYPNFAIRLGYMLDKRAVPDAYVEPSLPEGNRHNYTFGFGYTWGGLTIDGAYHILLQDDREIENSVEDFNGEYTGLGNLFGISLGYSF